MPTRAERPRPPESRVLTREELWAEARLRFGAEHLDWAFQCPSCQDVATGADIRDALIDRPRQAKGLSRNVDFTEVIGQECIGRVLGKGSERGCMYAAFGFIHGPWQIVDIPGRTAPLYSFPLAAAPDFPARGGHDSTCAYVAGMGAACSCAQPDARAEDGAQ